MRIFESRAVSVVIFLFFALPNSYVFSLFGSNYSLLNFVSMAIYFFSICMCLLNAKKFGYVVSRDLIFVLLIMFIVSTSFWSYDQSTAFQKAISLCGLTMVGYFWLIRFRVNEFVRIGFYAYSIISIVSAFLILFVPQIGLHQAGDFIGYPRGIYPHKNGLGTNMLYASLFSVYFYSITLRKSGRLWAISVFCLSASLLIGSKSSTALVMFCLFLLLASAVKVLPKMNRSLLISLFFFTMFATTLAAYLFAENFPSITSLLGKDPTLTGRTQLWSEAWAAINERPVTGYGFQTFWDVNPKSFEIFSLIGWDAFYAHNGILDTLIQVGFIGLSLLLISFLKSYVKSFTFMLRSNGFVDTFPFVMLSAAVLYNMSETTILIPNSIHWVLFVYAIIQARKERSEVAVMFEFQRPYLTNH